MVEEGHIVGNHTYSHPDMSQISTREAFEKELSGVEQLYEELTGEPMKNITGLPRENTAPPTWRWPAIWDTQLFFWSLAYVDWYQDDQPTK